ncbi:MAG: acyl-CoA thioesterase [Cytophagales bacterium]|nr:MAG: acyl-CoA thioesterase [Cytophagales bacterium]
MTYEEKLLAAETHVFKTVFPNTTNHHDTLFGGMAMQMMDETAFITATRFCRKKLVTVASDKIDFELPIPAGTFIELIGKVVLVGNSSIKVQVDIYIEQMYAEGRIKAVTGTFSLVAIDDDKKPIRIID